MIVNPSRIIQASKEDKRHRKLRTRLEAYKQIPIDMHNTQDEHTKAINVTNVDKNLDSELTGMGNSSLGVGIPDTSSSLSQ